MYPQNFSADPVLTDDLIISDLVTVLENHISAFLKSVFLQNMLHPFIARIRISPDSFHTFRKTQLIDQIKRCFTQSDSPEFFAERQTVHHSIRLFCSPFTSDVFICGLAAEINAQIPGNFPVHLHGIAFSLPDVASDDINIRIILRPLYKALLLLKFSSVPDNFITFRTVVETGSFTNAAEKLNYSQAAITFQIGQLEQDLSVKLFEKAGRKMVLTDAGKLLIPYVDDVFRSVDRLRCFENDLSTYRGDLQVGVGETLLCYRLPALLKEFHARAPQARLHLRSMNCYDIRSGLLDGTLDLGIFYEDIGGFGSSLTTFSFGSYPLVLAASPETGRRFPDFITPDRTIPVSLIINEEKCIFRQIFEEYLRRKSIILDDTIELWSIPTIKNLVKNNMGITFLPRFAAEEELKNGELVEIPTEISHTHISAVCAYRKNKWISPLIRLFTELIQNASPADSR